MSTSWFKPVTIISVNETSFVVFKKDAVEAVKQQIKVLKGSHWYI